MRFLDESANEENTFAPRNCLESLSASEVAWTNRHECGNREDSSQLMKNLLLSHSFSSSGTAGVDLEQKQLSNLYKVGKNTFIEVNFVVHSAQWYLILPLAQLLAHSKFAQSGTQWRKAGDYEAFFSHFFSARHSIKCKFRDINKYFTILWCFLLRINADCCQK